MPTLTYAIIFFIKRTKPKLSFPFTAFRPVRLNLIRMNGLQTTTRATYSPAARCCPLAVRWCSWFGGDLRRSKRISTFRRLEPL